MTSFKGFDGRSRSKSKFRKSMQTIGSDKKTPNKKKNRKNAKKDKMRSTSPKNSKRDNSGSISNMRTTGYGITQSQLNIKSISKTPKLDIEPEIRGKSPSISNMHTSSAKYSSLPLRNILATSNASG